MLIRRATGTLTLLAAIWLASSAGDTRAEDYSPRLGQQHPDFVLPGLTDGAPVALSQFRGRKVLLIHFASW